MSYFFALLLSLVGFGPADTPGDVVSFVNTPAPVVATIGSADRLNFAKGNIS
jgi:hypothetical protein